MINVGRVAAVQNAWKNGQKLSVHGLVYNLKDGILKDLGITLSSIDHIPDEYQIVKSNQWFKIRIFINKQKFQ